MKTPGEQLCAALIEQPERRHVAITLERKAAVIMGGPGTTETVERMIPGPVVPLRLRSLIPPGRTVGSAIVYMRETSITSSPVIPVAAGALKPQASLTYETVMQPVVNIPAFLKISAQAWEDFAFFQSWVDNRMLYALSLSEEAQLLNGNGVAPNLQGLMQVALTAPAATGGVVNGVASGIAFLYGYGYVPSGIVVNPTDWGAALVKGTAAGYLLGPPAMIAAAPTLWGIPVVLSGAMVAGSYLVGQFNPYCQIFDREDAAIEVSEENQDDFIRNLITVRAEERLTFAVYQPGAFAKGTFTP